MRTTVDLPDELHRRLRRAAFDRHISMSRLVSDLLEEGLGAGPRPPRLVRGEHGLLVAHIGRPITSEEVAAMEDEELGEPGESGERGQW